jgi:four helix bundle protein
MTFKFERLDVWQRAIAYVDHVYTIADRLPASERYNLRDQMIRAATSVPLNIAEGSTGRTDADQARYLGQAIGSLLETVACFHIIHRRAYMDDEQSLRDAYRQAETLVRKLQAMRTTLAPTKPWVRESAVAYEGECAGEDVPF